MTFVVKDLAKPGFGRVFSLLDLPNRDLDPTSDPAIAPAESKSQEVAMKFILRGSREVTDLVATTLLRPHMRLAFDDCVLEERSLRFATPMAK